MNTGYLHAIAALALAGYLWQVSAAGNADALYAATRQDAPGFFRWGLASAILLWAFGRFGGAYGLGLGTLVVVGMVLSTGPTIIEAVEEVVGTRKSG